MNYFLLTDTENDCVEKFQILMQNGREAVERDSSSTSSSSGNMNVEHNIRLLNCILKDEVIEVHRKSQESMSRTTLDARKPSEKLIDCYELDAKAFNDEAHVPDRVAMEGVHPKLSLRRSFQIEKDQ